MLQANNLVKFYGKKIAVNNVSLTLKTGEIVGLLGSNGAGKTTTFYMIVGVLKPNKGRIIIDEIDITAYPLYRRARIGIGYLPQESSIFRGLSVRDNIMAVLELHIKDKKERMKKFEQVVNDLKLERFLNTKGESLSGGERRRAEIARALVLEPKFFLLDEPFTGIDPKTREELQDIIKSLKDKGIGVLITDHNVRETLQITDRAYLMHEGEILFEGTSYDLINNNQARELYFGKKFEL